MKPARSSWLPHFVPLAVLCACFLSGRALAQEAPRGIQLPAGTELHVRLETKLTSNNSKPNDAFEALVIVPVMADDRIVVPAGTKIQGQVKDVRAAVQADQRALLDLNFSDLVMGNAKTKIAVKVADVDNARESVNENGQILGILSSETLSAQMDKGIAKLSQKYSGLADVLQAVKGAVVKETVGDIDYEPGVEMTLKLNAPLKLNAAPADAANLGPKLETIADQSKLAALATVQPFQTVAQNPPKPSDVTNMMFIGSEEQLTAAFKAAGWSTAAALSATSKLETMRAIVEARGYKEAPVSILLLDGKPPDLVFQKQNDTFAQRHHLRIWRRPDAFQGKPVWVCAATHDIGIEFSDENRTFIHKIDSNIDRERAKVVNDLLLTGMVKSLALVQRPEVPTHSRNATGDDLETDAAMAVLVF
ncbi:MAG: hypothetical protein DMG57_05740 [Acidobacteria bacterium]|nr:MAG: hypothetical protein DMG57_05740 [Acidobacteriota bacterium]